MLTQKFAADGTELESPLNLINIDLERLKLKSLPKGMIGVNSQQGLVEVIQTASKKPVFMKLGKLLHQQGLDEKLVRESSQVLTEMKTIYTEKVKFAHTEEDILRVYQEGPHSCMANSDSVRVYANDYTAVAYLEVKGKIIARCVVCKDEEVGLSYVRVYGFEEPLVFLLRQLGYSEGSLVGCYLPKIEDCSGIICPYIDGINNIDEHAHELEIVEYGEYSADSTNGYLHKISCEVCDENVNSDEIYYSEHTQQDMCESCFDESHIYIDGEAYHKVHDDIVMLADGTYAHTDDAAYVDYREEYYLNEEVTYNNYTEEYQLKDDLL